MHVKMFPTDGRQQRDRGRGRVGLVEHPDHVVAEDHEQLDLVLVAHATGEPDRGGVVIEEATAVEHEHREAQLLGDGQEVDAGRWPHRTLTRS